MLERASHIIEVIIAGNNDDLDMLQGTRNIFHQVDSA